MKHLTHISPIDGRYHSYTHELGQYFSEAALMRYRLMIEIEYLIALTKIKKIFAKPLSISQEKQLRSWYTQFSPTDSEAIKKIEETTNHDVKAIEYFLKEKMAKTTMKRFQEYIHFALTSEDINNLAYTLLWRDALQNNYLPLLEKIITTLGDIALDHKKTPMLALTHGQSATPTTVGKELFVFVTRFRRQQKQLNDQSFLGKLSGATGTWGAHAIAYPDIDWVSFSKKFIEFFGLEPNLVTTQIESHDSLAESYHTLIRINTIAIDFTRDMWMYISRGIFGQKKKAGEVGSSTMPHKINPIDFENAEGNFGIANSYLGHLAEKLPLSRMQRDLTDSTVLRNQGVPLAHAIIGCKNILRGLEKMTVNHKMLQKELDDHWEILAEPIQTILRKVGYEKPYEKLKELTRGAHITKDTIREFIQSLDIDPKEKKKLLALSPETYTGLASDVVI